MPKDRRANKAEARAKLDEQLAELPEATREEIEREPSEGAGMDNTGDESDTGASNGDAPHDSLRPGDFEAVSERQRDEVNSLFRLVHSEGYMTAGTYDISSDGENTIVSVNIILPSSPGAPSEALGGSDE